MGGIVYLCTRINQYSNEKDFYAIILNYCHASGYGSGRTRSYEVFRKSND